jgi:dual specificity MAP kinase phosphatase
MTEIVPHLWVGDIDLAKNLIFLESNIDVVINCTEDIPFFCEKMKSSRPIYTLRVPVNDDLEPTSVETLANLLPSVTSELYTHHFKYHRRILVHCFAGIQRSASVVAAYLIRYFHYSLHDAIVLLKSKRMVCFTPYNNFYLALEKFANSV